MPGILGQSGGLLYVEPDEIRQMYITSLSTAEVPLMALFCDVASRALDGYCDRRFYTSTGDETKSFDGPANGRASRIFHPGIDIASVTTLQLAEDNQAVADGEYTTINANDYYLQPADRPDGWPAQWIELPEAETATYGSTTPFMHFQPYPRVIRVTGKFGWNSTTPSSTNFPPEIRVAAAELAVKIYRSKDAGYATNIGFSDVGTTIIERHLSPLTRDLIERYRKGLTR